MAASLTTDCGEWDLITVTFPGHPVHGSKKAFLRGDFKIRTTGNPSQWPRANTMSFDVTIPLHRLKGFDNG